MLPSATIIGIGWPGDAPGFACVLDLVGRAIHLRKEIENEFLADLIAECMQEIRRPRPGLNPILGIVGRNEYAAMQFINDWNRDELKPWLEFGMAPQVKKTGEIYYHLQLIYQLTDPDKKQLFLLPEDPEKGLICKLRSHISALPAMDVQTIKDSQYPAIAALGYGCAFLDELRNSIDYENRQDYNKHQTTDRRSKITGY